MVLLATAATVIASQAVITGAFSVSHQAVQLGYLPRLRIAHTSDETVGQIYVPWINWVLMVAVLTLVFAFRASASLAYAFGMAVTGTITITTLLFFYFVRHSGESRCGSWSSGRRRSSPSNCSSWRRTSRSSSTGPGCRCSSASRCSRSSPPGSGVACSSPPAASGRRGRCVSSSAELHRRQPPLARVPGHGRLPQPRQGHRPARDARQRRAQPRAARARGHPVDRDQPVPRVDDGDRIVIDDLGFTDDGIMSRDRPHRLQGEPQRPAAARNWPDAGVECPLEWTTPRTSCRRSTSSVGDGPDMPRWRKRLFVATSHITADAAGYFGLPPDRTVVMGSRMTI